jgi:hypothetical protein
MFDLLVNAEYPVFMTKRSHDPHPYRLDKPTGCDIEGCERPHHSNGLCVPHWQRRQKYNDPLAGPPLRKQRGMAEDNRKRQSSPDYCAKHRMVRELRGPAWHHSCEHCDLRGDFRAQSWATRHGASGERVEDYIALCWSCHAKYDNFARNLSDNTGSKRTPEQRERMRQAALKRYENPAQREKARQAALLREARKRGEVI